MDIFITTFEAVAALLFIGIVGFYVVSRKMLPENAISILATLTLDVALPALIFANIITDFDPSKMANWWLLPIYFLLLMAGAFVAAKLFAFLMAAKHKPEFTATLFFQNAVFFPIAIISSKADMQEELLVLLFFLTLLFAPLFFTTAPLFFGAEGKKIDKGKLFNPILIATILGMGFVFIGIDEFVPDFAIDSLSLVGKMAAPLLMIILGGSIYLDYRQKGRTEFAEIVKFVIAKNIIFPLIMLGVIYLLKPGYQIGFLLILQGAVPPITSLPVIAIRHGGNSKVINQFMVFSFLASLITIPLFIALFEMLYV